jgi:hypothetical protein
MKYSIKELVWNNPGRKTTDQSERALEVTVESHFRTLNINEEWYHLNLPKMIFFIRFTEYTFQINLDKWHACYVDYVNVVVPHEQIGGLYTDCPLKNIYKTGTDISSATGQICFGQSINFTELQEISSESIVEKVLDSFYLTSFVDVEDPLYDGKRLNKEFYEKWQKDKKCPLRLWRREAGKAGFTTLKLNLNLFDK